jgi:hypothetical protein
MGFQFFRKVKQKARSKKCNAQETTRCKFESRSNNGYLELSKLPMFSMNILFSLAGLLTEAVIFVVCVYYMSRTKSTDSRLLLIGSLAGLIVRVFYLAIPYLTLYTTNSSDYQAMEKYYTFAGLFSFVGYLFYCIGFVLLIQRVTGGQTAKT